LVARKPDPQTLTKYHARTESYQRCPDNLGGTLNAAAEKEREYTAGGYYVPRAKPAKLAPG
jgi:hypothetical protein